MIPRAVLTTVLTLLAAGGLAAQESSGPTLVFASAPQLIPCPDAQHACARLQIEAQDAQGAPGQLGRSKADYRVFRGDKPGEPLPVVVVRPLVATNASETSDQRYYLYLFDLSGSMNKPMAQKTRFDVARDVLAQTVRDNFVEGTDHWAIVGFHSRGVVAGIRAAVFGHTKGDVLEQVNALERPSPRNNTALYSAVRAAFPVLAAAAQEATDRRQRSIKRLYVFTDGVNEVNQGRWGHTDDPGLLGPNGLGEVRRAAGQSKDIEVITIGFGEPGGVGFDETALRALAFPQKTNYYYAGNARELSRAFGTANERLASRVELTIGDLGDNKSQLPEPLWFIVTYKRVSTGDDPEELEARSSVSVLRRPAVGDYPWNGNPMTGEERKAWRECCRTGPLGSTGLPLWLVRVAIFGGFGAVIALAWFGLPRLIWPELYIPRPNIPLPPVNTEGGARSRPVPRTGPRAPAGPGTIGGNPAVPRAGDTVTPGPGGTPARPARLPSPPPRGAAPRPPARDPGESTVFIPKGKRYDKDS
jgi:hypothetical protein